MSIDSENTHKWNDVCYTCIYVKFEIKYPYIYIDPILI